MKHRTFTLLGLLVLLALVVAPVAAAPALDDPPMDPETGEEIQTFVEFGPSNAAPDDGFVLPFAGPSALMAPAATATALPAGYLPSYDDEALGKFDVQKALESVRYLATGIGPRVTGTRQEQDAAEYFGAKLASYGYEVSYQHWAAGSTKYVATVTSPNRDLQGGPDQTLGGPIWGMTTATNAKFTGDAEAVQGDVIYAGNGQSASNFPADTSGKIVLMDYSSTASIRNTAVVNAVSRGAVGVILAQTSSNAAPPGAFSLTTAQPNVPVAGAGRAHGDWIKGLLAEGPLTLRIASFVYANPQGTNVVAVRHAVNDRAGTAPVIMVGGHIDGVAGAPAAHDNGTGPSTAVEIGRILAQYALDKEIRIVGYGGEEIGMYGSKYYVATLSAAERARFVGAWDLDMEGTPYAPAGYWALTPNGASNFVVQSAYDSAARMGFTGLRNCRLGQSDHQSFYDAGIPASLFIWLDYRPNANGCGSNGSYVTEPQYHRPTDTMSNVSPERLEISLKLVGGAAFHSALNAVRLSAAGGGAVSGVAVEADCGDGPRYLGETGSDGTLPAVIPHATCDFTARKGLAVSTLDDVSIAGDADLAFSAFQLAEPLILHQTGVNPADGDLGVDWASCAPLNTNSVGLKSVTCADSDGHASPVAYNVIYKFENFGAPVDPVPTLNVANAGQTIPLKWHIADVDGVPVNDLNSVGVTAVALECTLGTTADLLEEYTPGASGLRKLGGGDYAYNWATPKSYAGSCKTLKLDLGEGPGMERIAFFQFVK